MKFFEYLKEAKKDVESSETKEQAPKKKVEYADGEWAAVPTTKTLQVQDLINKGKIGEYSTTIVKDNPFLSKTPTELGKKEMVAIPKMFPSVIVTEAKPIILLTINLLKKGIKEGLSQKVIKFVEGPANKIPKGTKEDVFNGATEIDREARNKGLTIKGPNFKDEVILYCLDAKGSKVVSNSFFRTVDALVSYVASYKDWLETGVDTTDEEGNKKEEQYKKFEIDVLEHLRSKVIAPVGTLINDDFGAHVDSVVGYTNSSETKSDPYVALIGTIDKKRFVMPIRLSKENVESIFSYFGIAGKEVDIKKETPAEYVDRKVKEYWAEKKRAVKEIWDRSSKEKKDKFGNDFTKVFKAYQSTEEKKDSFKDFIKTTIAESENIGKSIDVKAIREWINKNYTNTNLNDYKEIPKKNYIIKDNIKAKAKDYIIYFEKGKDGRSVSSITGNVFAHAIGTSLVGEYYEKLHNKINEIELENRFEPKPATSEEKMISFSDVKEGKFKEEIVDGENAQSFRDIVNMLSSTDPSKSQYVSKDSNGVNITNITRSQIRMGKDGNAYLYLEGNYKDNGKTKHFVSDLPNIPHTYNLLSQLFNNGKTIADQLKKGKEKIELERKKNPEAFFVSLSDTPKIDELKQGEGKKVVVKEAGKYILDKSGKYGKILNQRSIDPKQKELKRNYDWTSIKNNGVDTVRSNYQGVSKLELLKV